MGMTADYDLIYNKLMEYAKSEEGQETIFGSDTSSGHLSAKNRMDIERAMFRASNAFIRTIGNKVRDAAGSNYSAGELGDTAVAAINDFSVDKASPIDTGVYRVHISFSGDLHRDSLNPSSGGVDDIVELLDSGYSIGEKFQSHKNRPKGIWHGHRITALGARNGADFINSSIEEFMSQEAEHYGVKNIERV